MPSWSGAQLKHRDNFTFTFTFIYYEKVTKLSVTHSNTRMYPKFSGLAAWSENWKWYRPLPLSAVVSLFCESI
jgi:hypothetical protein